MPSSGSSPSRLDDFANSDSENGQFMNTRVYNKLAPMVRQSHSSLSSESSSLDGYKVGGAQRRRLDMSSLPKPLSTQNGGVRKRGRQSKDEQLAMENGLPASAEEFAAMTHMEIQRFMRDPSLSSAQKALIKKIRRRGECTSPPPTAPPPLAGRNKVAARKCRERRVVPEPSAAPVLARPAAQPQREPMRRVQVFRNDPAALSLFDY